VEVALEDKALILIPTPQVILDMVVKVQAGLVCKVQLMAQTIIGLVVGAVEPILVQ
jgi:hypothetical protein